MKISDVLDMVLLILDYFLLTLSYASSLSVTNVLLNEY